jgi:hypothetical protein
MFGRRCGRRAEATSVSAFGVDPIGPSMSAVILGETARCRAFDPAPDRD